MAQYRRLGVLGGSFDPVHYGHLAAAEEARECFALDQVLFVPSGHPPHKDPNGLASAEDRFAMASIAVANNAALAVSRIEIERPGPHYAVDTLGMLQAQCPEAQLFFIVGADMLLDIPTWRDPERLLALYHFVGVSRPGWNVVSSRCSDAEDLMGRHRNHVHYLEVPGVAISSTQIRQRIQAGRSARYLVPDAVLDYIHRRRLYL